MTQTFVIGPKQKVEGVLCVEDWEGLGEGLLVYQRQGRWGDAEYQVFAATGSRVPNEDQPIDLVPYLTRQIKEADLFSGSQPLRRYNLGSASWTNRFLLVVF